MSTNHPEAPYPPEPDLLPPKPIPVHPASALAVLTPDERDRLFDWLETLPIHDVLAKVAAPRPHGFAIETHVTTLRRFHTRARAHAQRHMAEAGAALKLIQHSSRLCWQANAPATVRFDDRKGVVSMRARVSIPNASCRGATCGHRCATGAPKVTLTSIRQLSPKLD